MSTRRISPIKAARAVVAELERTEAARGRLAETFVSPFTGQEMENGVTISVRALHALQDALAARAAKREAA